MSISDLGELEREEEEDVDEDVDEEDEVGARHPRSVAARHRRGAPNGKANGRDDLFSFSTSFTSGEYYSSHQIFFICPLGRVC